MAFKSLSMSNQSSEFMTILIYIWTVLWSHIFRPFRGHEWTLRDGKRPRLRKVERGL